MMMTAHEAALNARMILPGSAEHAAACELSRLRGYDPDDTIMSVGGLPPLTNWQWLIAEQILEVGLRGMMARALKASIPMVG